MHLSILQQLSVRNSSVNNVPSTGHLNTQPTVSTDKQSIFNYVQQNNSCLIPTYKDTLKVKLGFTVGITVPVTALALMQYRLLALQLASLCL